MKTVNKNSEFKYIPKKIFGGERECFSNLNSNSK